MDSCNVMHGSKNGLETRIRTERASQMLDVDGDSCHHIHNACKQLCQPFDHWVEYMHSDIHNNLKWSPDLCQYFEEICLTLGIKFTMPQRFVSHRWLSCYDAYTNNIGMMDAFKVYYYSFLPENDKALYKQPTEDILSDRKVTQQGIKQIKTIWAELSRKKFTEDGMKRKERITKKVIIENKKTMLTMHFFISVLPLLKEYVTLFQLKNH